MPPTPPPVPLQKPSSALTFDRFDSDEESLVWTFLQQITALLDAWNSDATVELQVDAGGCKFKLPHHPGGVIK